MLRVTCAGCRKQLSDNEVELGRCGTCGRHLATMDASLPGTIRPNTSAQGREKGQNRPDSSVPPFLRDRFMARVERRPDRAVLVTLAPGPAWRFQLIGKD